MRKTILKPYSNINWGQNWFNFPENKCHNAKKTNGLSSPYRKEYYFILFWGKM